MEGPICEGDLVSQMFQSFSYWPLWGLFVTIPKEMASWGPTIARTLTSCQLAPGYLISGKLRESLSAQIKSALPSP